MGFNSSNAAAQVRHEPHGLFGSGSCYDASEYSLQVTFFDGTCYLTPLLGAWLADSMWGRYKTILFFSYIYLVVSLHTPAVDIECLA